MFQCDEPGCTAPATHALVDRYHDPIEEGTPQSEDGLYFCKLHAFEEGREQCRVCENFPEHTVEVEDDDGNEFKLKRTYPPGTLDADGGCSDH